MLTSIKVYVFLFRINFNLPYVPSIPMRNFYTTSQNKQICPYGGGRIDAPSAIDLTISSSTITTFENAIYPTETYTVGAVTIARLKSKYRKWHPARVLPIFKGTHPIEMILPESITSLLPLVLQQNQNAVITYITEERVQNITTLHLRELITHGSTTNDSIQNMFLATLCSQYGLSYLSTFFATILQHDNSWAAVSNWFRTAESSSYSCPSLESTKPILIPCHVHGSHWVGVVQRIINNTVHFFYADDLNDASTEQSIQQLFATHGTGTFYPQNAIWTRCTSITYQPHSNECGPRTLFAQQY